MKGTSQTRAWLILLGIAGGALAFQVLERSKGWTAQSKAEKLGVELLAAQTPEQAAAIAREMGELDDAAVGPLVQGLVSDEPFVCAAAAEEINRRIGAWRQLPRKASGPKVAVLAKELAEMRDAIPPEQQGAALRWAEAILLWPLKGSHADAAAVLTDCEHVLVLPEPDRELMAERLARLEEQKRNSAIAENPVDVEPPPENDAAAEPSTPAPIVSKADLQPDSSSISDSDSESDTAELVPAPRPREPRGIYAPGARPIEDAAVPEEPSPLPESQEPQLVPPVKASAEGDDLGNVPAIELMRDLHSDSRAEATAAEDELTRRGYKAAHLALARQLTSPDDDVRLKLVQRLPQVRGIDPRPWLLHLSEDADPAVRAAALGILRTSQDPELLQKLR